jgi:esterase/lipase superfamily enzyme
VTTGKQKALSMTVIAADPLCTSQEQIDEEISVIQKAFERKGIRSEIDPIHSLDRETLVDRLRETRPVLVHFTGHGSPTRRILLEDKNEHIRTLTGLSLFTIFKRSGHAPDCVVLNNCDVSRGQSDLTQACKALITATPSGVFDLALEFSRIFYASVTKRMNFENAYRKTEEQLGRTRSGEHLRTTFRLGSPSAEQFIRTKLSFHVLQQDAETVRMKRAPSGPSFAARHEPPDEIPGPRKYPVWFATNRRPLDPAHPEQGFGGERDAQVHYGICEVAIPKYHRIGSIGTPWYKRWPFWRTDRLRVIAKLMWQRELFWADLSRTLTQLSKDERVLLFFLHGYNVSFDEAMLRAAQFGADLNVPGATAVFSWPSKGSVWGYPADEAAVEGSESHIRQFVEDLAAESGAQRIHIVAHSMGNRGLLRTFDKILSGAAKRVAVPYHQIFLAAADVDAEVFRQLAVAYPPLSERTTMYVCARDRALFVSGSEIVHDYERAGYTPPVTIVNGIDTIDVSNIDLNFLGHSYIAEARQVLSDMYTLMQANTHPDQRFGLERLEDAATRLPYWRIRA